MTTRRMVQGWPARVVHRGVIPGLELLELEQQPRVTGAACLVDTGELLLGKRGFRKASALADGDAYRLALLSTVLLEGPGIAGKGVLTGAEATGDGVSSPAPARLDGHTLTYWRPDLTLDNDVRVTVDLDQLTVQTALDTALQRDASAPDDPVARALQELSSESLDDRLSGVRRLDGLGTAAADAALVQALLNNDRWQVRKEVARRLGQRSAPPAGAVEALGRSLLLDGDVRVRSQAAMALGSLGDASARPVLEKAAAGDADAGVRSLAATSLRKLGG